MTAAGESSPSVNSPAARAQVTHEAKHKQNSLTAKTDVASLLPSFMLCSMRCFISRVRLSLLVLIIASFYTQLESHIDSQHLLDREC